MSSIPKKPLSVIAERWLLLDGRPFSLRNWPMHKAFYDGRYRRMLLKTGRQVAKSTTLANFTIIECAVLPHFRTMFVSPSKEQTVRFSNARVSKTMTYSPIIKEGFLHPDLSYRMGHKQFRNGAEMYFTYACDDPDRLRGISADRNCFDEIQDMLYDPVIIVGNECLSQSNYGYETYAGTPKTMENTIQYLWETSTQTEWVMMCDACGCHQYIDDEKSVGKLGPVCVKCDAYLNPFNGQWIDLSPPDPTKYPDPTQKIKGFHISQLIMPENVPAAMEHRGGVDYERAVKRWHRILRKHIESPPSLFRNEVLGVSDAIGTRMISLEELQALCVGVPLRERPESGHFKGVRSSVAGIDWSGGGASGLSRTVLWIWGHRPDDQKLVCLFYKVYPGKNPVHAVEEIGATCKAYNVQMAVGDAGEGAVANGLLRRYLDPHRVQQVQYGSHARALKWNGEDRYIGDRTTLIDNYFMELKRGGVEFGPEEQMKMAIEDILNEYEEVTQHGKKVWRHSPQKPDDCLHAGLFGWIAFKISIGDLKFYQH